MLSYGTAVEVEVYFSIILYLEVSNFTKRSVDFTPYRFFYLSVSIKTRIEYNIVC